ncbi:MAG: gliding motility-associated C-terminal domain-containing protein, partial [Flavobacteriaceae bacterium]
RQSATRTSVLVNLIDPGFSVVSPSFSITEGGSTTAIEVSLTDQPSSTVVLDLTSSQSSDVTFSSSSLTFTNSNWNVSQTVTISTVDDIIAEGTEAVTITLSVNEALSDACYDSLADSIFNLNITDNDVAGYLVGTLSGTLQENNPATQSLTVRLTAAPAAAVIIDITNSDATESNLSVSSLTFTAANWNVSQTVSIASVDDSAIDGTQTSSIVFSVNAGSDASFTGLSSTTRTIDTLDDDVVKAVSLPKAGFAISLKDNTTSENGDSGSFEIKLLSKPTDNVSLQLFSSNSNEGTVTSTVSFTPANWSSSQTIYVYGVDDSPPVVDGPILFTIETSNVLSDDMNYSSISGASIMDLNFLNSDNDIASVNVIVFNDNYNTNEKGGTVTLLFELTSKPSLNADVILPLSLGSNTDEAILEVPTMKIVNNNWNQPYSNELIIKGLDDFYVDGDQNYTVIVGDPSSTDPVYDLLTAEDMPTVGLINVDDDVAGFNFNIPNKVSEDGESTTLSVSLTTNVVSSVILDITVMDQTELSVSTSTLIFNTNNWATSQEIQIFGLDDDEFDGNIISTILLSINNLTTENSYRNVAEAYIAIENSDNDFLNETESNTSANPDTSAVSLTEESNEVSEEVVFTELTSDENLSPEEKIKSELKIPNAFSPNGDGTNDGWEIEGIDKYPNNRLEIWNRWGLKVYEKVNYQNDWIGQLNVGFQIGVTNELPQGTYFYRLLVEERVIFKGFIYLKREE